MENTAKNFALQLGSLVTLYISIGSLIALLFGIITVQYPDQAQLPWEYESATSSIRFTIAMLIVFFPAYVVLTRFVNTIRRTEQGTYLTLTKWLIYLSLLVGGGVLLGDLVAILNGFLEGELTIRFILKALAVLLVTGSAFTYYLLDVRGYWKEHEQYSIYYAGIIGTVVLLSLITGFMNTETPSEVRDRNLDAKQITDMQEIQYRIEAYTVLNEKLPTTIEEAYDSLTPPFAPDGRTAYMYQVVETNSFKLCAEFAGENSTTGGMYYSEKGMYTQPLTIKNPNDWNHGAGIWCFTRVLNTGE
jgi:hypothetical protein